MGLRERKKLKTRLAILDAAAAIARERGLDALRVHDVIERVEISEATFFNYFTAKADLLDGWVRRDLANAFAQLPAAESGLRAAVRTSLRPLAQALAREPALAAEVWSRGRVLRADAGPDPVRTVAEAFAKASAAGELRTDVPTTELAEVFVGAVAGAAARALRPGADGADVRAVEARIRTAADLVLDGARKRHERVRMPARAASVASP